MTNEKLKNEMSNLQQELQKSTNQKTDKIIIAKAVQLGMKYQEQKIKEGIDIVFNTLNVQK